MHETIRAKLENIPQSPGVYQFKSAGKVLYVGKAINLRNRVRSYFQRNLPSARILSMTRKADDIEIIATDNEIEALILENNLIKLLKPRYNVNLKDDKTFPYIRVTKELYPRIFPTRNVIRDGSKYFGPYTDVRSMRAALQMINRVFRIRSCKLPLEISSIEAKKFSLCLEYHIKKCDGPCEGLISPEEYGIMVKQVMKLLSGKTDDLITEIREQMETASTLLFFEKAAECRDKIMHLEKISEKQKAVTPDFADRDVIALFADGKDATSSLFIVRNGKLIGKRSLRLHIVGDESEPELLSALIKQYYSDTDELPEEIITEVEPDEVDEIIDFLKAQTGKSTSFHTPKRGTLVSLLKMAKENARLQLSEIKLKKLKAEGSVPFPVTALQRDLRLPKPPMRIECFDNSNSQGEDPVASMVVFEKGRPKKSEYRKFSIKTVEGPDDFASMHEVISRRYKRLLDEKQPFPDLIIVDGGKGQLSAAVAALKKIEVPAIPIIGLAKRFEEVFIPGQSLPVNIPKTSSGLKLLQRLRDEAHRFAVTFHRQKREKRIITTELTSIQGIGEKLAQKLLNSYGSVFEIKKATLEQLTETVGEKKATLIFEYFNRQNES
mgnify:FL=1